MEVRAVNAAGLKSTIMVGEVDIPARPPKEEDEKEPEELTPECELFLYYIDLAYTALSEGDVYNFLRYRDLAQQYYC